jgi:2-keto-4-pentenoate hydratase/2-oxohepta-3-ene-1,7-dioic acid hydratase in catechol pathway
MIRSVPSLISELSRQLTLKPGTVVLTGAPTRKTGGGVPETVRPGDEVVIQIEGIGTLRNTVAASRRADSDARTAR